MINKTVRSFFNRPMWLFLLSVLVLFLNFSGHYFSALPFDKYLDQEFPSERFVFSRLIYNLEHGTAAEGGFMLHYNHVDMLHRSVDRDDYAEFKARLEGGEDAVTGYISHYGLQDDLMFPLWRGLEKIKGVVLEKARPGSRWHKRLQRLDYYYYNLISQHLVALVNALVLAGVILWVAKVMSPAHGWLVLLGLLLFQPVLGFFGRSMWWMMWSWFLPFLIALWGLYFARMRGHIRWAYVLGVGVLAASAVLIKVLMGYEYVAPCMMAVLAAIAFYALYENWGVKRWFVVSFVVGLFCLCGALGAMWMHYHALEAVSSDPLQALRARYEMRAYGGETLAGRHGEILESTKASFWGVLGGYLISGKELSLPHIFLLAPFFVWLWGYIRQGRAKMAVMQRRLLDGLAAGVGVGFLGGVSMLLILKGHAYIHGFDVVIWSIPMDLFLMMLYAQLILPLDSKA